METENKQFGICINDGSELLSSFSAKENIKRAELFDWQQRAIDYFFQFNKVIFQCATGCLGGDTLIEMPRDLIKFPKGIPIKDLVGKRDFFVYGFDIENKKLCLNKVNNVWLSRKDKVYKIVTSKGNIVYATGNHPFLVDKKEKQFKCVAKNGKRYSISKVVKREYKKVEELKLGDYLTDFHSNKILPDGRTLKIFFDKNGRGMLEQKFIANELGWKVDEYSNIHHKDGNHFNNKLENIEVLNRHIHLSNHSIARGFYGRQLWEKNGHPRGFLGHERNVKTRQIISVHVRAAKANLIYEPFRKNNHSKLFAEYGYNFYKYKPGEFEKRSEYSKKGLEKLSYEELSIRSRFGGVGKSSDKIISIIVCNEEDVYDMEVDNQHNFIANNLIVHNSGKSFLAVEIIKRIFEKEPKMKVLIVVPKNVILEDTWYPEMYKNGINLPDIGVFYGKVKEYAKITLTNVQNLSHIELPKFNCIILDECHNVTERIFDIIDQKDWKYMIGLSATFERRDNKHWKLARLFEYNVFNYTPRQALDDGVLNPFNFMSISVEMDDITYEKYLDLTKQLNLIFQAYGTFNQIIRGNKGIKNKMLFLFSERKQLLANYPRKFYVAQEICKKHRGDKIIIFNQYNTQTNKLYWFMLECDVKACVVHSGIKDERRQESMIGFKTGKYNVMLTSKVLDEGYNLPSIDTGIIMAGDSVKRQTIQRMGRVLRKKIKPSELYLLYCKGTIEEENAKENKKFFKELCTDFNEHEYKLDKELQL